jgi:2Fe-2S type ferredoxin
MIYQVTLINYQGVIITLNVSDQSFILDVAEVNGIQLPKLCRKGRCVDCIGRIMSGEVDQSAQSFLEEAAINARFVLLCVASPRSNCTISTNLLS